MVKAAGNASPVTIGMAPIALMPVGRAEAGDGRAKDSDSTSTGANRADRRLIGGASCGPTRRSWERQTLAEGRRLVESGPVEATGKWRDGPGSAYHGGRRRPGLPGLASGCPELSALPSGEVHDQMKQQRSVVMRGLRIIGSYIATHPLPFAIAVAGATIYAGMTVGSTIVLGRITDHVLVPAFKGGVKAATIWWGVVAIMAVGVIRAAGIILRRYFAGMTGSRMRMTLTNRVVDQYQALPLAYHRSRPTGELMAHAEADVQAAIEVIHPLPWSLAVVLLVVFATIALLVTDLFLAVINRYYTAKVEDPATKAQERIGDVSTVAHESIDGALMVKTLGRERAEVERLKERAMALRNERVRMGQLRAAFEPAFEAIPAIGIIVLIAVGSWRASTGAITVGR